MNPSGKDILIRANGINVCYDDFGSDSTPLIFIHGFPFDKSSWTPQVQFLQKYIRVIAFDNRGFGKSSTDEEPFSMDLFADDLIHFMDALQIDRAIVCGLSMGGYILLNAINRYPNRFEKIILADTQCNGDTPEGKEKRYKAIEQLEQGGLNEYVEGFINNVFTKNTIQNDKTLVEKIRKTILSTPVKTITSTLDALAKRNDTCEILGNISVPALILCGKDDVITPVAKSEFIYKNIKSSVMHILENAAHLSNLEQPDMFNRHIHDFVISGS